MSKELEALEIVKKHLPTLYPEECGFDNIDGCFGPSKECQYELDIIETALKRLEEIDKIFKKYNINDYWLDSALYVIKCHFPINTETQLKKLKALEIIKKKGFSTNEIAFIKEGDSWETYIETMKELYWGDESLDKVLKTHEEFDLLKEVLL